MFLSSVIIIVIGNSPVIIDCLPAQCFSYFAPGEELFSGSFNPDCSLFILICRAEGSKKTFGNQIEYITFFSIQSRSLTGCSVGISMMVANLLLSTKRLVVFIFHGATFPLLAYRDLQLYFSVCPAMSAQYQQ